MIETRIVSSRMARSSSSGSTRPRFVDGQKGDVEAFPFSQMFERVQDSVMFGAGTDQVTAAVLMCARQAEDGQII